jgi:ligand-binding SRPBCC domain-containing protein
VLTIERSATSQAPPEQVWQAWVDVGAWSEADHIDSARLEGDFAVGSTIKAKTKGFPASTLTITEVEEPRQWVDESRAPGMRMTFVHAIEPRDGGTVVTERVVIRGPVGQVVGRALRRRLDALLEASVGWLARRAEAEAAAPPD